MKAFRIELAEALVVHGARLMSTDFNIARLQVIPELRARGLQVSLAAWHPYRGASESEVSIDSCAILVIGPCAGAQRVCSVRRVPTIVHGQ